MKEPAQQYNLAVLSSYLRWDDIPITHHVKPLNHSSDVTSWPAQQKVSDVGQTSLIHTSIQYQGSVVSGKSNHFFTSALSLEQFSVGINSLNPSYIGII